MDVAGVDEAQHAILQKIAWETVSAYPYAGIVASRDGSVIPSFSALHIAGRSCHESSLAFSRSA